MGARGDKSQVVYVDGDVPQLPIQLGQLLVDSSQIALGATNLQQCTSQDPLTYEPLQGGYPLTAFEVVAGVVPASYLYPYGDVRRYGMVPGNKAALIAAGHVTDVNGAIYTQMMAAAAASKGMEVFFPLGEWCGNFASNTDNITVIGSSGVGEYSNTGQNMLRPYTTGTGAVTLRFSNGSRLNEKCGVRNLCVAGFNDYDTTLGLPTQAEISFLLDGGIQHFNVFNLEILEGLRSLHIQGSGGFPVTQVFFAQFHIRNSLDVVGARCIYMRRPSDAVGYVTSVFFDQFHINGPGPTNGYWLELDGTGGPGLEFHPGKGYVDQKPGCGVLMVAGNELMTLDDVNMDPATTGAVIIERLDTSKNPCNAFQGSISAQAGQRVRVAGPDFYDIPPELNFSFKKFVANDQYITGSIHYTNSTDPFDWTFGGLGSPGSAANLLPEHDMVSSTGPNRWKRTLGLAQETINGARWTHGNLSEEITLSTSGLTTDSSANLLPANSIIEAVVCRVTTTITTTTNWAVGDPTTSARFSAANATLASGTTSVGITQCDQAGAAGPKQVSAAKVRITCTGSNPGAGKIRVTTFFRTFIAPTS